MVMEWVSLAVFLSVFHAAFAFNIDPVVWKSLRSPDDGSLSSPGDGFGYKVVQRQSSLLVSAPLQDRGGQILKCSTDSCSPIVIYKASNFGLTMANDPTTGKTIACGPTIPRECRNITTYNGECLEINADDTLAMKVPSSPEECPEAADIAFLLDGSASVQPDDFKTMKDFVKGVIRSLVGRSTKFAVAQYSQHTTIHYHLNDFDISGSWETQIDDIGQQKRNTNTAGAITQVVNSVFSSARGSRPKVKKFLIVITDGASSDKKRLPSAVSLAEQNGIVRFAIGVGSAFRDDRPANKAELDIIATNSSQHVFRVDNFDALDGIRDSLKDSIFSIEGSQTSGGSLKLEMAQEGFSAAYVPGGGFQMAAVGAFQWRGSYQEVSKEGQRQAFKEITDMDPDSYLGYSMAIAKGKSGILTVVGAPRYKHMGVVMVFSSNKTSQKIDPSTDPQFQIGAYFGAEVCTMDVDRNGYTDVILISAPTFTEKDREGRIYVCSLTNGTADCRFDRQTVLKGVAGERGRFGFGSSLAPLPDLNSDGFNDLAVGAPLENGGQGSIYIFHGDGQTVNPMYSQRIRASDVQPGLRFFGLSISQSSFDLSGDSLPDLAVGSKGAVLLLRSKPIVMVKVNVTFSPDQIPTNNSDCNSPLNNTAKVCFTMTNHSTVETAQAQINYTLTLDSTREIPNNRAYIETPKQRQLFNTFTLDMAKTHCFSHEFNIKACPEDEVNKLCNELGFTFEGVPSSDKLSPILAQQAQTTTNHPLAFENITDNLKVDFNFTSSTEVRVGIDDLLNVMVSVENREGNSFNSSVTLTYPPGLSYRKSTQQGRVKCNSLDAKNGWGKTDCTIDKPVFKSNAKVVFTVSYGIVNLDSELDRKILITANATSGNAVHSQESRLYQQKEIDVKYSLSLSIFNPSSLYTKFIFGRNDLQTPHLQSITVENTGRAANVTVVMKVPVKLGDIDIWVNPGSMEILGCDKHNDEEPTRTDFVDKIKKDLTVDCSVARCAVFRCNTSGNEHVYDLSANLRSGWIEQIGLQSAKFSLISTATWEYDRNKYFSPDSENEPPVRKIVATVEVYTETDLTNAIIGGSVGGFVLLALITAGLYKAGFFKSQYKQRNADQDGEGSI